MSSTNHKTNNAVPLFRLFLMVSALFAPCAYPGDFAWEWSAQTETFATYAIHAKDASILIARNPLPGHSTGPSSVLLKANLQDGKIFWKRDLPGESVELAISPNGHYVNVLAISPTSEEYIRLLLAAKDGAVLSSFTQKNVFFLGGDTILVNMDSWMGSGERKIVKRSSFTVRRIGSAESLADVPFHGEITAVVSRPSDFLMVVREGDYMAPTYSVYTFPKTMDTPPSFVSHVCGGLGCDESVALVPHAFVVTEDTFTVLKETGVSKGKIRFVSTAHVDSSQALFRYRKGGMVFFTYPNNDSLFGFRFDEDFHKNSVPISMFSNKAKKLFFDRFFYLEMGKKRFYGAFNLFKNRLSVSEM